MRSPFNRHKESVPPQFTGNCFVRQYTNDGAFVGRCYHSTYGHVCPFHGDVLKYMENDKWPRDFELPLYDGSPWAETLRQKIKDNDADR